MNNDKNKYLTEERINECLIYIYNIIYQKVNDGKLGWYSPIELAEFIDIFIDATGIEKSDKKPLDAFLYGVIFTMELINQANRKDNKPDESKRCLN